MRFDELLKLGLALRGDVRLPLLIDPAQQRHRLDEVLDEVALAAQGRARVDRARDLGTDFLVVAVALLGAELLDEHEDVVDVDLDLLDELDFEHDVVVDDFSVAVAVARVLVAQPQVDAGVVLPLSLGEWVVAVEVVEGREDVLQPQDRTEQLDEVLLRLLPHDLLPDREVREQFGDLVDVLAVVVAVRFQQDDAAGILVAEQLQRGVRLFLEVAEGDDVAVGLHRVEDAVRARVRLDQSVGAQVLVDEQRVQRRRVEAGEEHVHHDDQVDLAVLHPLRQVLVVVLEPVRARVVAGPEHVVVVLDRVFQERARVTVERIGVERFIIEDAVGFGLVRAVAEDQSDLQPLVRWQLLHLQLELVVVTACGIDRRGREQRVESANSFPLLESLRLTPAPHRVGDVRHDSVFVAR